jgi:hypothetical protein
MTLDIQRVRQRLQRAELKPLFVEELGWTHFSTNIDLRIDATNYSFLGLAQKRGVQVFRCELESPESLPDFRTRQKLEKQLRKSAREHLVVYLDREGRRQVWKPVDFPAHEFYPAHQSGDALIQKLTSIRITLDDEESLDLLGVTHRLKDAFDRDRVTKRFYDRFKTEHLAFLEFTQGIKEQADREWYASLMLNRLMFVYFIQKKGFLDGDEHYLRHRLESVQQRKGKNKFHTFYRYFLLALFHKGFSKQPADRRLDRELVSLLGTVPYLNGGLFDVHELEIKYAKIDVPDAAFEQIFAFFDQYDWHLDARPLRDDREINPDVLGYIFEKYINQKQMGAYYTKEDITEYISKNTIIPFLFDAARKKCAVAFQPDSVLWKLLRDDPDRYIYPAVRKGVVADDGEVIPLPVHLSAGIADVSQRGGWNQPADSALALPTETWREYVSRRERCLLLRGKLAAGEILEVNDLITWNLDIRRFADDAIAASEGSEFLRAVWQSLSEVTVLDPTCGSGAFLFAALGILQPLYTACLDRMHGFVEQRAAGNENASPRKFEDFRKTLAETAGHPSRDYFILKSIIVHNLYGVDIMEEAVEICKLRLFLKLVSQVERVEQLEPLPDIDFNVRSGNTLVGFSTLADVKNAFKGSLAFDQNEVKRIVEEAEIVDRAFEKFHEMQTHFGLPGAAFAECKRDLRHRLDRLTAELDTFLAGQYGVDPGKPKLLEAWRTSHQPFHWFAEFYGIMRRGGFDVIIGNPPYIEMKEIKEYKLRSYHCESAGNLYAVVIERCIALAPGKSVLGFIVPVSSISTDRYVPLQRLVKTRNLHYSSFDDRPSRLFDGLQHIRLTIHIIGQATKPLHRFSTRYNKWSAPESSVLFDSLVFELAETELVEGSMPKLSATAEQGIYEKLVKQRRVLRDFYSNSEEHSVHYSRKVGYFLQVLDFEPEVLNGQGERRPPSEFKTLNFDDETNAAVALACLNSSLFYWFVTVFSDCRHVNKREVDSFPIDVAALVGGPFGKQAKKLADELMLDLDRNSERRRMSFRHETLTVQCIIPKRSKAIIDRIDQVLSQHYGFTATELDFIINYDIKYRLGQDAAGEDDE